MKRALLVVGAAVAVLAAVWLVLGWNCPRAGLALTSNGRELHRLKNRTAFPGDADFDSRVTLDEFLRPANDKNRWSMDRAGTVQGWVIEAYYARPESTNCYCLWRRDVHIAVAKRPDAPKNEQVIVEVTPNLRPIDGATGSELDSSEANLRRLLVGHLVEFEGWLFFDASHVNESENTAPHNSKNWRATAWEIHPVTKIRVIR
jgi:hypothetical protein